MHTPDRPKPMDSAAVAENCPRFFAVIARDQGRVAQLVASFAEVGELVQTKWFPSPDAWLSEEARQNFDAVIYYAQGGDFSAEFAEEKLRASVGPAAFFRVAA